MNLLGNCNFEVSPFVLDIDQPHCEHRAFVLQLDQQHAPFDLRKHFEKLQGVHGLVQICTQHMGRDADLDDIRHWMKECPQHPNANPMH